MNDYQGRFLRIWKGINNHPKKKKKWREDFTVVGGPIGREEDLGKEEGGTSAQIPYVPGV